MEVRCKKVGVIHAFCLCSLVKSDEATFKPYIPACYVNLNKTRFIYAANNYLTLTNTILFIYLFLFLLTINLKLIIVHVEIKIVNKEAAAKRILQG